jgi:tetratricopeptide (TPR) repeat protein
LQILGSYSNAVKILKQVNDILGSRPNSTQKIVALRSLGEAFQLIGNFEQSRTVLEQSLEIAKSLGIDEEISASLLSLGIFWQPMDLLTLNYSAV